MMPFEKCPKCGDAMVHETVEKLVRGGSDVALLTVEADICHRCGERYFALETAELFERVRAQLENHDTADLTPVGSTFQLS
jgi:YgiT-type zinc finger domain-containing protein